MYAPALLGSLKPDLSLLKEDSEEDAASGNEDPGKMFTKTAKVRNTEVK